MSDVIDVGRAMRAALLADAQLVAALGSSTGVYPHPAPDGAAYPFVTYQHLGSGDRAMVGQLRAISSGAWLVRGIAQAHTFAAVETLADRIDAVLHDTRLVYGTTTADVSRETVFSLDDPGDGTRWVHLGGQYRVWFFQTS